jgi:hypothetical protein
LPCEVEPRGRLGSSSAASARTFDAVGEPVILIREH